MRRCGLPHLTYLIEGSLELLSKEDADRLRGALAELEVSYGFHVSMAACLNGTYKYLELTTRQVLARHRGSTVAQVVRSAGVLSWAQLATAAHPPKQVGAVWGRVLLHAVGMQQDTVQALLDHGWHCPKRLLAALEQGGPAFAEDVLVPGRKRRKLSADLHAFFTERSYRSPPEAPAAAVPPS